MEQIGNFLSSIILLIIAPLVRGFVFVKLWSWFVIDVFNVRELRIVEAIGIMVLFGLIQSANSSKDQAYEKLETYGQKLGYSFFKVLILSFFALLMGWIVYKFK